MDGYRSDWIEINVGDLRSIKWRKDTEDKPSEVRENGELIVHYNSKKAIYSPVMYGWFLLIMNQSSEEVSASILCGVMAVHENETNMELLDQIRDVMNLDELEGALLIRLHSILYSTYKRYGIIKEDFKPIESCTLLAFLIKHHRGRNKKDIWSRAAATHSDISSTQIKKEYDNIEEHKIEAMRKITQFASTTGQRELPTVTFNDG